MVSRCLEFVTSATKPRAQDYTWTRESTTSSGKKLEVLLVSQDSTQYCLGQFTRKGKEPAATKAFNEATDRFKNGSVWRVDKISLAKKDPTASPIRSPARDA